MVWKARSFHGWDALPGMTQSPLVLNPDRGSLWAALVQREPGQEQLNIFFQSIPKQMYNKCSDAKSKVI